MAKGQVRSTKEVRKPKKDAGAKKGAAAQSTVTDAFAKSSGGGKPKKK